MPRPDAWDELRQGVWPGRKQGSYEWFEIQDNVAYWKDFESPKIVYPDIALSPQFAWEDRGLFTGDTTFFIPSPTRHLLAVLNSSVCSWFFSQISPSIQNGYYRFKSIYCKQIPIPPTQANQADALSSLAVVVAASQHSGAKFEQLINGLVYELFFPDDLHAAGIRLFEACGREHITRLAALQGPALQTETEALAERIFNNSHPIYAMLFDLKALDVVRIIEVRD